VHGRFDPFSGVQGTSCLRIRVGQRGHASECGAPRIRRRSHQHPTEASALGGPMKDRLRRWLTPMLIDRMRRGTHDRADATGPCRGCATAVSCRAASCMSRRPCPRPVCYGAHCTSVAQTCRAARRVTRQLLPRSPTDVPAPSGQRRRRTYPDNCYKRQAEAVRGGDLDQIARLQRTHICTGGGFPRRTPAAAGGTRASRMHSTRKMQLACSQAHPHWPAEAALSASRV